MQALSDRKLTEPYRSWIDRTIPLPASVRFFPRTIDVGTDALVFLAVGGMMGGMGVLIAALMPPWRFDPAETGWGPPLFVGAICLGLWSVPFLLLRRLVHTMAAAADQRRGRLRQGLFVGAEGLLVRMEPRQCHPIPAGEFVGARLFPPPASKDGRKPTLIVETRTGSVEFFAERLAAQPKDIHGAARELWPPKWKEPGPLLRRDRKKQADLVVFLGLVLVAVSVVNLFYRFLTLKLFGIGDRCASTQPISGAGLVPPSASAT